MTTKTKLTFGQKWVRANGRLCAIFGLSTAILHLKTNCDYRCSPSHFWL